MTVIMNINIGRQASPSVHLSGDFGGTDVTSFYESIAEVGAVPGQRIVVDVSQLTSWTLLAQIAVLHAAREQGACDCELALVGASLDLRQQATRLDLISRVQGFAASRWPIPVAV